MKCIEEWETAHNSNRQYEVKLSRIRIGHTRLTTSDIDEHWNTLCNHITAGANLHIPTTRYKLMTALTMSTKTKNLLKIYNDRYTLYKYNMSNDKIQILGPLQFLV